MKQYSPYQFTLFRIILGSYLIIHFAQLLAYAPEIWSDQGVLPMASLNLTHGIFPNLLSVCDTPAFVQGFVGAMLLLSVLFLFGMIRPVVSLLLWYGWVALFDRNNLISNPGIPFIGWILLCCAVVPAGEPLSLFPRKKEDWKFPPLLFIGAWVIMALGYTLSGIDKLNSPSWKDGTAMTHLLNNPLARDWGLREFLLSCPEGILKIMTWSILALEIAFAPLVIFKSTRKWAWLLMILMHLGILFVVDFADLTCGMLMIHWFTFDATWLKPAKVSAGKGIVFFDGVCGMCNSLVDFLMLEDRNEVLLYTPLQGETAAQKIKGIDTSDLKTVVYIFNNKTYVKSEAILRILISIGGIWKLAGIFRIVPRALRNFIYDLIAKNRYKWFGQKEACRMPTPEERAKFLP